MKKKIGCIYILVCQLVFFQVCCVYYCLCMFFLYILYIFYFVIFIMFFKFVCNRYMKFFIICMISVKLYCQVVFNFWFIGCGFLLVVKDGEWECFGDVFFFLVFVYEFCYIVCKGDLVQIWVFVKVRCIEKLEWDRVLIFNVCSVEKSFGMLN